MTRGQPGAEIVWLISQAEWLDPVDLQAGLDPNTHESTVSSTLNEAGLGYDRISPEDRGAYASVR